MPHVPHAQDAKHRNGQHSKKDIQKATPASLARDDLTAAFAGKENNGKPGLDKIQSKSTNVKSRQSKQSKLKTPIK